MPSKLRCKGCKSVVTAPDAARGKAIRCPKCKEVIRVPRDNGEPEGSPIKKSGRKEATESEAFVDVDLRQAEDSRSNICVKCGADIDESDDVCPGCGFDLVAHGKGKDQPERRTRSQREAEFYFREIWRDAWSFMKINRPLAVRTTVYWVVALVFGSTFCSLTGYFITINRLPLVVVFGLCTGLFLFGIPGWGWSLWTKIIDAILEEKTEKDKELTRVHLDVFMVVNLGIKGVVWVVVNAIQFSIVTAVVTVPLALAGQNVLAAAVGGALAGTIGMFTLPVVMAHMAMPVQWKAWAAPIMWMIAFKNLKAVCHWWMVALAAALPLAVIGGGIAAIVLLYTKPVVNGLKIEVALGEGYSLPGMDGSTSAVVAYVIIAAVVLLTILFSAAAAFGGVFAMRAQALFTKSFKRHLNLIAEVVKKKYVSQSDLQAQREEKREGVMAEKKRQRNLKKIEKMKKKSE